MNKNEAYDPDWINDEWWSGDHPAQLGVGAPKGYEGAKDAIFALEESISKAAVVTALEDLTKGSVSIRYTKDDGEFCDYVTVKIGPFVFGPIEASKLRQHLAGDGSGWISASLMKTETRGFY